jgi:hypothetical protein
MRIFRVVFQNVVVLGVSAGVFLAYLYMANLNDFPAMLDGTAMRPSAYRVLIPSLAEAGAGLLPLKLVDQFRNAQVGRILAETFQQLSGGKYFGQAICALALIFFSVFGFILVEKQLLRDLGYSTQEQSFFSMSLAILTLPFSMHFAYVYDLPQVFLFSLSTLFLYRGSWPAYLAFLTISLLNKETSAFLIIVFALYYYQRLSRRDFAMLLVLQLGIFAVIRTIITYVFRDNPGVPIYWSMRHHLEQYTNYPSTFIFTLFFLGGILFLMVKDWKEKPVFLQYTSLLFFLVLILFFFAGMPMEFRVFLDILPVFGILLFPHHRKLVQPKDDKDRSHFSAEQA